MRKSEGKTAVITGEHLLDEATSKFGSIDILVNNARYNSRGPLSTRRRGELPKRNTSHAMCADQSVSRRGGGSADKRFGDGPQVSTRGSIL